LTKLNDSAKDYNPVAMGSDAARTKTQYFARKAASAIIALLRLNSGGFFSTEIVQKISPVCTIPTKAGEIYCRGGHGRLHWRAETFYSEEPETIDWLNSIGPDDLLWDIGSNVGLYSIYAAKVSGCHVIAFEPEAQNYAIMMENIALNSMEEQITAAMIPLMDVTGLGKLLVHDLTKSGAWNRFVSSNKPREINSGPQRQSRLTQVLMGVSADDFVDKFNFECPTHIKIDTDGNEPEIIKGMRAILKNPKLKHILIEEERDDPLYMEIDKIFQSEGFKKISTRVTSESRPERNIADDWVWRNAIYQRS